MKRRTLIKQIAALSISLTGATAAQAIVPSGAEEPETPAYGKAEEIAPGVFFLKGKTRYFEDGNYQEVECNNGWIIFDDFVLLVDANFPGSGPAILREIRSTTNKPIRFVFNTHHHSDHLYGNSFWMKEGATPLAHVGVMEEIRKYETGCFGGAPGRWEQAQKRRTDLAAWPLLPPVLTFSDTMVIEDKHRRAELIHPGAGHTRGDGIVWLPKEQVLFAGDACLNGPYNLFRDAEVSSWTGSLERMAALQPKIVVTGHGNLGDGNTPRNQQHYFQLLLDWVKTAKLNGNTFEGVRSQLPVLRQRIAADPAAAVYLIAEPEIASGFSLESHIKRIFETL
ncbi:MBL fold metallo-hydrolase [Chitinophaga rhizosphaerae]|uniref:MBL fold metallo-hydrolase n=1 Tax=Chitinophaga rhizosphaerae TaxID=1864947 RepID=UPI000F7FBB7E|nr:MBL fold metallo-hydrolase [Chitinophaga rhizosphaerae]